MATSLPWNVKGVDPRTRDAARAAARRAGMSLGEWLDSVIRDEATDAIEAETSAAAEELEALSERLSRLNQGDMDTAAFAGSTIASRPRRSSEADRKTAAETSTTRKPASSEERTAAALDSIARWIEKTEQRLSSSERATAERQERATTVVADAIKTIGSRIAEIERREVAPAEAAAPAPMRNGRPVLSRESLASAVSDIRLRQRDLDSEQASAAFKLPDQLSQRTNSIRHEAPASRSTQAEDLLASLRQDLKELGARIGSGPATAGSHSDLHDLRNDLSLLRNDVLKMARATSTGHIEAAIRDLSARLQQDGGANALESLTRPLQRIETEIARLAENTSNPAQDRIESELAHIAGRIDALASRGSDGRVLAAATRELSAIRDLVSDATGAHRLEELAGQLTALSGDVSHVRENQVKGRDIDSLREAIADMRQTMAQGQQPQHDGGAMIGLSRQIEALSSRINALPSISSGEIDAKISKLVQQLERQDVSGKDTSDAVANRIEALVIKLEDLAERAPARMEGRIEGLAEKLERMVGQGASPRELPGLERKIETLSERLEQLAERAATPEGSSRLERQIEGMTSALETLATQSATPRTSPQLERQIEAMAARLESLADSNRLTQVVSKVDGKTNVVDMRPLEDMVRSLSKKLDEAQSPGADNATLAALENQVGKLAEKLDIAAAARAENSIESTLQGLIAHFKDLQSETTAAAERAAREALTSEFRRVERQDSGGMAKLSEAMSSLQVKHDTTGQQTNTALDAVHETLERIVSRLGRLEGELARDASVQMTTRASAQAPATAPKHVTVSASAGTPEKSYEHGAFERRVAGNNWPPSASERVERRTSSQPAASDALDTPLEPGSGRPKPAEIRSESKTATPEPALAIPVPGTPAADLRNIIAAARRAAQTVKAEAASAQSEVTVPGKRTAKTSSGLKDTIEKRRKPLLLGLAAIVLALGATHVINGQIGSIGKQSTTPVVSVKPETSAMPAANSAKSESGDEKNPTETPQLPSKDQNSMLSPSPVAPAQAAAPFVRQIDTTASAETSSFVPGRPANRNETAALPATPPAEASVSGLKDLPTALGTPGLRKAALGGDARAVYELAVRAADGVGGQRDPKTAIKLFERAAGAGLAPAQFRLGNMFEKGIGAPRDVTLARLWYERAAEKGNAKAMHNLAVLYAEGATGKPDYTMAVEWFKKASEHGMRDSQFNLGVLLARGLGTEQNFVQSWTWFAVGAAQGDEDAAKKRDEVGIKLSPTELAAAKLAVSQWKPKSSDPSANEVVSPAQGWDDLPGQAPKKPAKARNV